MTERRAPNISDADWPVLPPAFEGQGVAGKLVRTALEHARDERLAVWPACPFVRSYVRRHPGFQDLVSTRARD